jgi:GH15 family glucan-1,4-alpha-glucosidase
MEERLRILMHGGETGYTYAWRKDFVYLCIVERLNIPMYGGETEYTYAWRRDWVYLCK